MVRSLVVAATAAAAGLSSRREVLVAVASESNVTEVAQTVVTHVGHHELLRHLAREQEWVDVEAVEELRRVQERVLGQHGLNK